MPTRSPHTDLAEIRPRCRSSRGAYALVIALTMLACGGDPTDLGGDGPTPEDFAILFVGNSLTYSNDLPTMLQGLFDLGGAGPLVVHVLAYPNYALSDHWADGVAQSLMRNHPWDHVVLQQGPSATEGRPSLLEYAGIFATEIRKANAVPALFMVWPSAQRAFDFDGVLDSYRTAAEQADGLFFPAGEAWRVAWDLDPDVALYGPDGFHPSVYGTYVAALVMYEQLSGRDPRDLPARIPNGGSGIALDPALAATLQEAAAEANRRHARTVSGT
ncbi:MAG: SGNH/GDSL hydrolase family protein [Gemmatimonadota bacterium]|nr:SGNH/GDSL hydrolase family protein [Gemmatimonadota bacterium]